MSEIKVRLSLEVPGATMLSTQDCVKMSKKEAYDHTTASVVYKKKKGKKDITVRETLHINTRRSKPAKQVISISKESYLYMTDKREIPPTSNKKVWEKLSANQRLEHHFALIAEDIGATSFYYEILND